MIAWCRFAQGAIGFNSTDILQLIAVQHEQDGCNDIQRKGCRDTRWIAGALASTARHRVLTNLPSVRSYGSVLCDPFTSAHLALFILIVLGLPPTGAFVQFLECIGMGVKGAFGRAQWDMEGGLLPWELNPR